MPAVLCEEGAARWWRPVSSSIQSSPPGPLRLHKEILLSLRQWPAHSRPPSELLLPRLYQHTPTNTHKLTSAEFSELKRKLGCET